MRARSFAALEASSGAPTRLGLEVEVECLEDLRAAFAVCSPGTTKLLLDPPQRLLVAVEQLDLEFLEAAGHALVVEDGDCVVDDLGAVGPHALAPGAQARDRHQGGAAKVSDEQVHHFVRRRAGPALGLELEPRVVPQQLQLPEPLPVLDPVP